MDVILLKDMDNLGFVDDVVDVKPGYARNFLIPRGKAVVANKQNMAELNKRLAEKRKEEEKLAEKIQDFKNALEKASIEIPAKVGTTGKLFGTVTTLQLSDKIKQATGFDIDRRKIEIVEDITVLGTYNATIDLPQEELAELTFDVVEE